MGRVYLLQSPEFINSNVFKIGHSNSDDLKRCFSYGSKTILYYTRICNNSSFVEKKLIEGFNKRFKVYKGREYFIGNINEMINEFHVIYDYYANEYNDNYYNNNHDDICNDDDDVNYENLTYRGSDIKHFIEKNKRLNDEIKKLEELLLEKTEALSREKELFAMARIHFAEIANLRNVSKYK